MATADSPPSKPSSKNFWDVVLTATPVVLTVLGTALAGLASSEMTQSQYHRALAVQAQAKTSDQWGFFQAKNIRRRALEISLAQMPSLLFAGRWDADRLVLLSNHLTAAQTQASRQLQALRDRVGEGDGGAELASVRTVLARPEPANGDAGRKAFQDAVKSADAQPLYQFLGTGNLPAPPDAAAEPPDLKAAIADVKAGRSERQIAVRLVKHDRAVIQKAIEDAEENARTFENASKPVEEFFTSIQRPVSNQLAAAEAVHRAILEVETAAADAADGLKPYQAELQALRAADQKLQGAADALGHSVQALREDYNGRRYRFEGEYNQKIAFLYEVLVRYEGTISELHLGRSRNIFFGMLCAQAGVAVASTALAARHKNALWALASLAGFLALAISLYVYLW